MHLVNPNSTDIIQILFDQVSCAHKTETSVGIAIMFECMSFQRERVLLPLARICATMSLANNMCQHFDAWL
jgi:hypothetical protein